MEDQRAARVCGIWTAKLEGLGRVLNLGTTVCAGLGCAISLASVIQDYLVQVDYCRVGWVGWREVAAGVGSLMYRCSAGGSWRRGRARRNAALQRPGARGTQEKSDPRSRRGVRRQEEEDWSQSCFSERVPVALCCCCCFLVLCCRFDLYSLLSFLASGSVAHFFSAGAVVHHFLYFFASFFLHLDTS